MDDIRKALAESPIAGKVGMETRFVIHEEEMDGSRLAELARGEPLEIPEQDAARCTLRIGGEIIASGRIVRRRGECYFRVEEVRR